MIPLNENLSKLRRSEIRVFTNLARQTPDCVALTIGEPDFPTPAPVKAAAREALERDETHYAPNQGTPELRQAIAAFETRRGLPTVPEQVLVTVGATGALYTALTGILNPGDEVIVLTPAFNLYESITLAAGGKPVPVDISETGFQVTRAQLESALSSRTRAIVVNSPCNPSGTILNRDSLNAIRDTVLGKDIYLICDNVYQALSYAPCPDLSLEPELEAQTILCQSFSKPYAMTGWRVGYLRCREEILERLLLLNAAEIAAVPTFLQHAAAVALEQDVSAMREVYRRRRDYVTGRLHVMGLSFPRPEGAFYVFPDIRPYGMSSRDFCLRLIREGGLALIPGSCFGCEGHVRLSYCCGDSQLAEGLDRLEAFLKEV
jgi:aspartate/methionine/tyrosine aminotransferase